MLRCGSLLLNQGGLYSSGLGAAYMGPIRCSDEEDLIIKTLTDWPEME